MDYQWVSPSVIDVLSEESDRSRTNLDTLEELVIESVGRNLADLLNTRQGSVPHLPDYGLPDFSRIYARESGCIEFLRQSIEQCIIKYEPRLTSVRVVVDKKNKNQADLSVKFLIEALLRVPSERTVFFKTMVQDVEEIKIRPM